MNTNIYKQMSKEHLEFKLQKLISDNRALLVKLDVINQLIKDNTKLMLAINEEIETKEAKNEN